LPVPPPDGERGATARVVVELGVVIAGYHVGQAYVAITLDCLTLRVPD
jgi:hypothetical protein